MNQSYDILLFGTPCKWILQKISSPKIFTLINITPTLKKLWHRWCVSKSGKFLLWGSLGLSVLLTWLQTTNSSWDSLCTHGLAKILNIDWAIHIIQNNTATIEKEKSDKWTHWTGMSNNINII